MHNEDTMFEDVTKKRNLVTLTRRPLSEMEMVDLMIYGEDVLSNMIDQENAKSLASNNLRKQNDQNN